MNGPRPDWHTDDHPELRAGPPWVMEEMVAAQPGLAAALLGRGVPGLAALAATLADGSGPVRVVGVGTSEHGAMAIAAQLAPVLGLDRVAAVESLEAASAPRDGVCLGLSHDGGTQATTLALEAARAAGATTALVTAVPDGATAQAADHVLVTPVHDDSWCHTVAYTSAILTGAALARELGATDGDAGEAEGVLRAALDRPGPGGETADAARILAIGAGADHVTALETALKIAEGARIATTAHRLETVLHGHLAGEDETTAAVLVRTGDDPRIARRAALAEAALGELGIRVVRLGEPGPQPLLHRLLDGAVALQRLTLALAAARGVNPDLIRREEGPWRAAAAAAESAGDW